MMKWFKVRTTTPPCNERILVRTAEQAPYYGQVYTASFKCGSKENNFENTWTMDYKGGEKVSHRDEEFLYWASALALVFTED